MNKVYAAGAIILLGVGAWYFWPEPKQVVTVMVQHDTIRLPGKIIKLPGKRYKVPYPVYYTDSTGKVDSSYIKTPADTTVKDSIITADLCFWYAIGMKAGYLSDFISSYQVDKVVVKETRTVTVEPPGPTYHLHAGGFVGYKSAGLTVVGQGKKRWAGQYSYNIYNNTHNVGLLFRLK